MISYPSLCFQWHRIVQSIFLQCFNQESDLSALTRSTQFYFSNFFKTLTIGYSSSFTKKLKTGTTIQCGKKNCLSVQRKCIEKAILSIGHTSLFLILAVTEVRLYQYSLKMLPESKVVEPRIPEKEQQRITIRLLFPLFLFMVSLVCILL